MGRSQRKSGIKENNFFLKEISRKMAARSRIIRESEAVKRELIFPNSEQEQAGCNNLWGHAIGLLFRLISN